MLRDYLKIFKNDISEQAQIGVFNCLSIIKYARKGDLSSEDLSELDLTMINLSGLCFSTNKVKANFESSIISDSTFGTFGHTDKINSLVYSRDGKHILSASSDETVKEWYRATGACTRTFLDDNTGSAKNAIYSIDENQEYVLVSYDSSVIEYERKTGKYIQRYNTEYSTCHAIYSDDMKYIIALSYGGTFEHGFNITKWDRSNGSYVCSLGIEQIYIFGSFESYIDDEETGIEEYTSYDTYNKDGTMNLTASYSGKFGGYSFYESSRGKGMTLKGHTASPFKGYTGYITSAVYSKNEEYVLSASSDGTIREWNRDSGECVKVYSADKASVNRVIYSTDGKNILCGINNGTIKEISRESGDCLYTFENSVEKKYNSYRRHIRSYYNENIILLPFGNNITAWDNKTGICSCVFFGHSDNINSVTLNSDKSCILSASNDGTIREWNLHTGECIRLFNLSSLKVKFRTIDHARYSNTGKYIISESEEFRSDKYISNTLGERGTFKTIGRIWSIETQKCLLDFEITKSEYLDFGNSSVIFSKDDSRIFSLSYSEINEWCILSKKCVHTFKIKTENTTIIALDTIIGFSNDWRYVILMNERFSDKARLEKWDRLKTKLICTFDVPRKYITDIVYSFDKNYVIFCSNNNDIVKWNIVTDECIIISKLNSEDELLFLNNDFLLVNKEGKTKINELNINKKNCGKTYEVKLNNFNSAIYSGNIVIIYSTLYSDFTESKGIEPIKVFDKETGICIAEFGTHGSRFTELLGIKFQADEYAVYSFYNDYVVKKWDAKSEKCLWTITPHEGLLISGCNFLKCEFSNSDLKELVRIYGGKL